MSLTFGWLKRDNQLITRRLVASVYFPAAGVAAGPSSLPLSSRWA